MGMRRRRSPHGRDFGADLSAFNREGQHFAVSGPPVADFSFDCDTLRLRARSGILIALKIA
jgi:hypothetical protein